MTTIKIRKGTLSITDDTVQLDTGLFSSMKRLYEQSRPIYAFLSFSLLLVPVMGVFDPLPLAREMVLFLLVFVILMLADSALGPKVRNNIASATEIRRTAIDHVEYAPSSWVQSPKLRIIVTEGEKTGERPVILSHPRLGGDQQLERLIQAFGDSGITVVPADDTDDDES
ncbi:hypothetical protein [Halocatena marina]|nr:hypothetical protein [Halocatena marina]